MNKKLINYISTTTTWQIKKLKTYAKDSIALPIHIFNKFDIEKYRFEGIDVLMLQAKGEFCDSKLLLSYIKLINKEIDLPIVFIFEECKSVMIQKMIKHKINFIVIDKYLYLPFALMNIETTKVKAKTSVASKLDNISKLLLVAYLSGHIKNMTIGAEIAKTLDKQPIVISKALYVLEGLEYISFKKSGRQKLVSFIDKLQIWQKAKHELYTPIKKSVFTNSKIDKKLFVNSGITALAKQTNLAKEPTETLAIYKREFNAIKDKLHLTDQEEAYVKIEVWDSDPKLLSVDGVINPLYLIINFMHEEDERINIALEELVEKYKTLSFLKEEMYA